MAAQTQEQNILVSIYLWRKTCKGKLYHPLLPWLFRFLHYVDVKWTDTEEMPLMKYLKPVFYFRITSTVLLANEVMLTDIYCKQTDKFQYFSPRSSHPRHCKWNREEKQNTTEWVAFHFKKRRYMNVNTNWIFPIVDLVSRNSKESAYTKEPPLFLQTILHSTE